MTPSAALAAAFTPSQDEIATAFAAKFDTLELRAAGGEVLASTPITWGAVSAGSVVTDPPSVVGLAAAGAGTAVDKAVLYAAATPTQTLDLSVSLAGGGGDLITPNLSIAQDQDVDMAPITYNAPNPLVS